jgi:hypothetical protein
MVELFATENRGTGVRALQTFSKGVHIGEYIGEVYPTIYDADNIPLSSRYGGDEGNSYMFSMRIRQQSDYLDKTQTKRTLKTANKSQGGAANSTPREYYTLDAAVFGNWTRYINHSCVPNTCYIHVNIGQRETLVIQALRDIAYGEELTVSYGPDYFRFLPFGCKCGYWCCKYWKEDRGRTSMTLTTAKLKGMAPAWAMRDPNIPIQK